MRRFRCIAGATRRLRVLVPARITRHGPTSGSCRLHFVFKATTRPNIRAVPADGGGNFFDQLRWQRSFQNNRRNSPKTCFLQYRAHKMNKCRFTSQSYGPHRFFRKPFSLKTLGKNLGNISTFFRNNLSGKKFRESFRKKVG